MKSNLKSTITEREIIVMEGDRIFVNVDPPYDYVQNKLKKIDPVIRETNHQTCKLNAVQSNAKDDHNKLVFGGSLNKKKKRTAGQRASAFGKTASAVFRMVMLKAVQIPEDLWPKFGDPAMSRNKNGMAFEVTDRNNRPFQLLNGNHTKENARECWSRYDQVFPHFLIENEVLKHKGRKVLFENTMFILRESAPQVIEITTKAYATMYPRSPGWRKGEFDCNVEVSCTCKQINDEDEENQRILNELREQVNAPTSSEHGRRRSDALR